MSKVLVGPQVLHLRAGRKGGRFGRGRKLGVVSPQIMGGARGGAGGMRWGPSVVGRWSGGVVQWWGGGVVGWLFPEGACRKKG